MDNLDQTAARLGELLEKATQGPFHAVKGVEKADDMRCGICAVRGDASYLVATIENGAPGDFCDTEWVNAMLLAEIWSTLPTLLAERTAMQAEIARLRGDLAKPREAFTNCEKCRAPLFDDDHIFTDPEGVSGCWKAMLDDQSKVGSAPCYSYRIGEADNG